METPVVFDCKGQQIVGMLHLPKDQGRAPAVLLVHGFTGQKAEIHRMFVKLARRLAAHGVAVLRFDFRGSGDSAGDFEDMTIRSQIADTLEAFGFLAKHKRVNSRRLGIVGLSLGGAISAHVAARHRTKLRTLVLLAPVAEGEGILDELATPEAVASLAQTGIADYGGNLVGVQFIRQFAEMKPLREVVKTNCPVLLVHGENDPIVPASHTEQYARALGNHKREVRKLIVAGADHTFNKHLWESRVLDEVVGFLNDTL